jgi:hypothetical protein
MTEQMANWMKTTTCKLVKDVESCAFSQDEYKN